jgi:hypothetical protein
MTFPYRVPHMENQLRNQMVGLATWTAKLSGIAMESRGADSRANFEGSLNTAPGYGAGGKPRHRWLRGRHECLQRCMRQAGGFEVNSAPILNQA